MSFTIRDLIEELESIAEDWGDDSEVRFAGQPSWPFEYSISEVLAVPDMDQVELDWEPMYEGDDPYSRQDGESDEDVYARLEALEEAPVVVYLAEGRQIGYLPPQVKTELGW